MVDIPADASTTATITVGGSITNTLETSGDHDWFRINLTAGQAITVALNGITLQDPYLRIRDANGTVIFERDDINPGVNLDSLLSFAAPTTGVYYIDVGSYETAQIPGGTGDYQLNVTTWSQPPVWTNDQIAQQLTSGYWGDGSHTFALGPNRTITVNITGLNAAGQNLALTALGEWGSITGINFVQTSGAAQITFDDNDTGAYTDSNYVNGVTSSAFINVDDQWLIDYGQNVGGYAYQAYLHEIGHALGLGHAGNYNTTATYPYDALYRNDAWATSVMSYFSQAENTYFGGQGFDDAFLVTPMVADILAIQQLYGLSTNTRNGDTVYGFNSNAGNPFNAAILSNVGFTIFDTGGTDTLDYSGYAFDQRLDLNPEAFSDIGNRNGNVSIARGTIIENAIGGSGNDVIIGNSVGNVLTGNGGNDTLTGNDGSDTLEGGAGADSLDGGAGNDRIYYDPSDNVGQVTGGAGTDTLVVNDLAAPTSYNLAARGFEAAEVIQTDPGSNSWSSIVQNYNVNWAMLQQTTFNDNGSRVLIQFDPLNTANTTQVWSAYDALNRLSSVDQLFDNGTRTFINLDENNSQSWNQDWFAFDAQGRLDSEDVLYDNGTRTFINIDQNNSQSWSQDWFTYDTLGRLDSEDVLYDVGTRTFINLDQDNSKPWSQDWFTYDAQGRLDSEDVIYDNGTRTFINLDQDNSQNWSQVWFTYDAQGRLDTQDILYDDGTRAFYNYDQANTEPFTATATIYNSNGTPYQQVTTWDDGSTTYFLY